MTKANDGTPLSSDTQEWLERHTPARQAVDLSIVVPAFNEEWRLPPTLIDIVDYFDAGNTNYEVLVVDDGSSDATSAVVKKFQRIRSQIKLIRLPDNKGKGHAVRTGILSANGRRILFTDADGSTPIREIERLQAALDAGADAAIGSRAIPSQDILVITRWYRKFLGRAFNFCANRILVPGIADTQCGFKMFSARAAQFMFERQRANGFSFDLEILFIAKRAGVKVTEIPVNWRHVPGSKVNLLIDAAKMFKDLLIFSMRHRNITPADFPR